MGKKFGEYWTASKPKKPKPKSFFPAGGINPLAPKPNSGGGGGKHPAGKTNKGTPIDAQGRLDLSQLAAQRLNFLDQYNQQVSDINRNYAVQRQRAMENEPYVQRGILSDYAGRGMAHSTGFGSAAGRETQLFNQNLNDLAYSHTYGLNDLGNQRTAMARTLRTQRQAVRQAAADRMAAQAGTLGLYTGSTKVGHKRAAHLLGLNNG